MMMYKYNFSLTEIENMMPWEKDVYFIMLTNEKEKEYQRELDGQ